MDSSDSSSDDECNFYTNAASQLNALNRRAKHKIQDDDDEDDDDAMIVEESENLNSATVNGDQVEQETNVSNDSCSIGDSEDEAEKVEDEVVTTIENDDAVTCIEEDDVSTDDTRSGRVTRNSRKRKNAIPPRLEPPIALDDSIERELNDSYDDSLNLTQDENDTSYVVIGSPPPAKKCNTDNYEVSIKVLWKSNKVERFEIKRYETFQKVFRFFANLEGVPEDQVLITKKEKRITPFDTPISINWSIIDILDGGVVSPEIVKKNKGNSAQDHVQENSCKIKVQTSDKRTLNLILKNDEPLTSLLHQCSEQLKIPESKIKFYFDGESVDTDETPESLDFDDEACVDLKILK